MANKLTTEDLYYVSKILIEKRDELFDLLERIDQEADRLNKEKYDNSKITDEEYFADTDDDDYYAEW